MTISENDQESSGISNSTELGRVGYRKPPVHSRFKKGVSGNPYGRRKKQPETAHQIFLREASREYRVQEGCKVSLMSSEQIAYARLTTNAARGHISSIKAVFQLMKGFEKKLGFGNVPWNEEPFDWGKQNREMWRLKENEELEDAQENERLN